MRWTLHYAPEVIAYLYALREEGSAVRQATRNLSNNPRPEDAWQLPDRPNMYEFAMSGYWVTYGIDDATRVVYVLEVERLVE